MREDTQLNCTVSDGNRGQCRQAHCRRNDGRAAHALNAAQNLQRQRICRTSQLRQKHDSDDTTRTLDEGAPQGEGKEPQGASEEGLLPAIHVRYAAEHEE